MLYTGMFSECQSLLRNEFVRNCIRNSLIDVVYIDNKCMTKQYTIDDVCQFIHKIKRYSKDSCLVFRVSHFRFIENRNHPHHAIQIEVDEFGYDDLPRMLQTKYTDYIIRVDCTYLDYFGYFLNDEENPDISFVNMNDKLNVQEMIT